MNYGFQGSFFPGYVADPEQQRDGDLGAQASRYNDFVFQYLQQQQHPREETGRHQYQRYQNQYQPQQQLYQQRPQQHFYQQRPQQHFVLPQYGNSPFTFAPYTHEAQNMPFSFDELEMPLFSFLDQNVASSSSSSSRTSSGSTSSYPTGPQPSTSFLPPIPGPSFQRQFQQGQAYDVTRHFPDFDFDVFQEPASLPALVPSTGPVAENHFDFQGGNDNELDCTFSEPQSTAASSPAPSPAPAPAESAPAPPSSSRKRPDRKRRAPNHPTPRPSQSKKYPKPTALTSNTWLARSYKVKNIIRSTRRNGSAGVYRARMLVAAPAGPPDEVEVGDDSLPGIPCPVMGCFHWLTGRKKLEDHLQEKRTKGGHGLVTNKSKDQKLVRCIAWEERCGSIEGEEGIAEGAMVRHLVEHHGNVWYYCTMCNYCSVRWSRVRDHFEEDHPSHDVPDRFREILHEELEDEGREGGQ